MKERLLKIGRVVAYPLFYVFCLALFGYLTFPVNRLRDRIIAEFDKHSKPGQRLEIEKISTYWFTGVELTGVKLTLPPDEGSGPMGGMALPKSGEDFAAAGAATAPKEATITIDEAHARVRILPLLIGRVRVDFWASALGGEISGTAPVGGSGGDVSLEIDKVELGKIEPLAQMMGGVPIKGLASGKLELSAPDGKWSKANGNLDLSVEGISVSDGKTKIAGMIELPTAKLGTLTISAEAKDGTLKVTKLAATGTDLELVGDGRVSVREPWNDSNADLYLKFKFTDAYRSKSENTKSLLGEPGSALPGLMEIQIPKMKRAKRPDGFYGWHVYGPLKRLKYDPSSVDVAPSATPSGTSTGRARFKGSEWKKPLGVNVGSPSPKGDDATVESPTLTPPPAPRPMATEEPVRLPDSPPAPPPPPPRPAATEAPMEQPTPRGPGPTPNSDAPPPPVQ